MFFFKDFIYLFLQRGREGEWEGEIHQCVVASWTPPTGDLACNPGMCPDWESNQWPFGLQAGTQSTEPHQPGLENFMLPVFPHLTINDTKFPMLTELPDFRVRAGEAAFSPTEVQAEATVSLLSPFPTEPAGWIHIWVSISLANTVARALVILWDPTPPNLQGHPNHF